MYSPTKTRSAGGQPLNFGAKSAYSLSDSIYRDHVDPRIAMVLMEVESIEMFQAFAMSAEMMADDSTPMNYYRVLRAVRDAMPEGAIIVGEGANTMDIGRTILNNFEARTRLDAGTYGTMGIGLGFAVAAAVVHPDRRTVAVQGDAAFGFSGMEVETACRYNSDGRNMGSRVAQAARGELFLRARS